jgi:riboflavin kinase
MQFLTKVINEHAALRCDSTANLSEDAIATICSELKTGVYYGWVQVGERNTQVYQMVMSIGWNPYYHNEKRSAVGP